MDYPKSIVSYQKEEFIRIQRVNHYIKLFDCLNNRHSPLPNVAQNYWNHFKRGCFTIFKLFDSDDIVRIL